VRQQIRNKQFTRDVIDTLGHRIREVILPVPRDAKVNAAVSKFVHDSCEKRVKLRAELAQRCESLFGALAKDSGEEEAEPGAWRNTERSSKLDLATGEDNAP
jgi:siroheme synthase (precorrin-2 oxidase/ferrochelatase)